PCRRPRPPRPRRAPCRGRPCPPRRSAPGQRVVPRGDHHACGGRATLPPARRGSSPAAPAPPRRARPRGRRARRRAAARTSATHLWTAAEPSAYKERPMATQEVESRPLIRDFPAVWQRVVTNPLGFFADMPETGGLQHPTVFLALCAALNAVGHLVLFAGVRGMVAIFVWQLVAAFIM